MLLRMAEIHKASAIESDCPSVSVLKLIIPLNIEVQGNTSKIALHMDLNKVYAKPGNASTLTLILTGNRFSLIADALWILAMRSKPGQYVFNNLRNLNPAENPGYNSYWEPWCW